jgi:hypothetical protein
MSKSNSITVMGQEISLLSQDDKDYICITDMAKGKGDESRAADVIKNWLRTRTTIEFLGTWEQIYNPDFKVVEFDHFRKEAGLPTFVLSPTLWVQQTGAIGIFSKMGKYGGTYAHKDIAFEFGAAISPIFKLYLIKEFQRLKELESNAGNIEWNVKRVLSKANYTIHTGAIKEHRIPKENIPKDKEGIIYADEAEMLNYAVFGYSSKEWRKENPELHLKGHNLRDFASINQLAVLSNMESINAVMLGAQADRSTRFQQLRILAKKQLEAINKIDFEKSYKKTADGSFAAKIDNSIKVEGQASEPLSDFNQKLDKALKFNPKDGK